MIIWGSKGRTTEIDSGRFFCPECADYKNYARQQMKRWFTLYFVPVFPTETLGDFIECTACRSTFKSNVLDYDPEKEHEKINALFFDGALMVMAKMALADGEVDDSERDQIRSSFGDLIGREFAAENVDLAIEKARNDERPLEECVSGLAPFINDYGREIILRAAILVAKADGRLDQNEIAGLKTLTKVLLLPPPYLKGILGEEGVKL